MVRKRTERPAKQTQQRNEAGRLSGEELAELAKSLHPFDRKCLLWAIVALLPENDCQTIAEYFLKMGRRRSFQQTIDRGERCYNRLIERGPVYWTPSELADREKCTVRPVGWALAQFYKKYPDKPRPLSKAEWRAHKRRN